MDAYRRLGQRVLYGPPPTTEPSSTAKEPVVPAEAPAKPTSDTPTYRVDCALPATPEALRQTIIDINRVHSQGGLATQKLHKRAGGRSHTCPHTPTQQTDQTRQPFHARRDTATNTPTPLATELAFVHVTVGSTTIAL